jgi:hypothetical protein
LVDEHETSPLGDEGQGGDVERNPSLVWSVAGLVAASVSWLQFTAPLFTGVLAALVVVGGPSFATYAALRLGMRQGDQVATSTLWGSRNWIVAVWRSRRSLPVGDRARRLARVLLVCVPMTVLTALDLVTGGLAVGDSGWWVLSPPVRVAFDLLVLMGLGYVIGFCVGALVGIAVELAPRLPRGGPWGGPED